MCASLPKSDQALQDLVLEQLLAGDIEGAKVTASQVTDYQYQREAWLSILYKQFNELNDLGGVKETILSLQDSGLWIGSWVHDLVLFTAKSGDIDGAKTFVQRLPENSARGHFLMLIVSVQAQQGDYCGADSTLATLPRENPWYDLALLTIVNEMVKRGDVVQTEAIIERINDSGIKASALNLCTSPAPQPKVDTSRK